MRHIYCFLLVSAAAVGLALVAAGDDEVVFRSDVNMLRVDAQVVDRDNRAITGLRVTDFVLRESGKVVEIRNFASDNMPIDLLLLLDVSASMRPHVQRVSSAAHQALQAFGKDDRVGIMVFDRSTRVRLPFSGNKADVEHEMETLLKHESFNGGTDITRGMIDAAEYVGRTARRDARHAIVIVTDDQTEFERDDERVSRSLTRADAVLSALIAPDAMRNRQMSRNPSSRNGGSWPGGGGGGGIGGGLGGIIFPGGGGRQRGGGGRQNGPMQGGGSRTKSAGTSDIARASGGDSMPVDDAYALENTLARLRQRYALYFYLPEGVRPGEERAIEVQLGSATIGRYPDSEVRYRRVYLAPGGSSTDSSSDPVSVTRAPTQSSSPSWRPATDADVPRMTRPRGDISSGPRNGPLDVGRDDPPSPPDPKPEARPADNPPPPPSQDADQGGGWRVLKPGEKP